MDVSNKVVVVTGAGGVLISAMAKHLAEHGASLALLNRTLSKAEAVRDQIKAAGGKAEAYGVDVTDKAALEAVATQIIADFGSVHILINGAGGNAPGATAMPGTRSFFDLTETDLRQVMDVNYMGTVLPSQVFGQIMAEKGQGNIINISSMSAFKPLTRVVGYSAAKAAVNSFTQWLAVHVQREYGEGLRVNAIAPGFFLTDQNRFLLTNKKDGTLTERGQLIIDNTPAGRFGTPEDLLSTLLWLADDGSRFVNGVVIPVDGGFDAFSGV